MLTRRIAAFVVPGLICLAAAPGRAQKDTPIKERPNVVVILTDDQGHGDLGVHGNPAVRTPTLDRLARQSVSLTAFHVAPVCSPTRASLLTGRYNYRTGVVDTYLGRSLMHPGEVTLAEMLAAAGYRTGIFGKWHLGDNYPLRAMDQGFQESLVLKGGGIGQPSDPPGGGSYFDPRLLRNGKLVATKGYCSDVFTDAAIGFINEARGRPFFVYLAFNAPHTPLQVDDKYVRPYRNLPETTARIYGMVTNIDENVGRLLAHLDEKRLSDNTIVVFLTDNGPQQPRYNSAMRGRKGSVYDGGIRVPCFLRWPGRWPAGQRIGVIAAHIDLTPTLLGACAVTPPAGARFDGRSLLPLLPGGEGDWPDRTLYFQWHRGDVPQLNRACAARSQRWKLVQPLGGGQQTFAGPPRFELYDMASDPAESKDVAAEHPDVVARMRRGYEQWFEDVGKSRGYAPPRIHLGAPRENPVVLTRQDWRGPRAGWGPKDVGHWEVHVAEAGEYAITLRFAPTRGVARIVIGSVTRQQPLADGATECTFGRVRLPAGDARLEASVGAAGEAVGVRYAEVERLSPK
jgi:arylsulfatase A-like enzyme